MIKNLKKVISAVAALAISASAVSAFAVNFPDVAEDASYAKAVQELSALDIISGFDDGTFRPDELVTRAQITKMIVDALNERASAEASRSNSQFQDVSTEHWAKGYINQGVADGFIAGYSDTEFGPDDNVTYVQAQKMLVSAIGYETFAQGSGGWPNGYKQWAATTGITSGVSGLVDDTQLTRAQVAQLIDNAMDAPVCVIKDWTPQWNGQQTPNLEVKDGEGKEYQTLFTKKHDAYKVYGRVTATSKTDSSLDNDKVKFNVEKADNFDDQYIKASNGDEQEEEMYFGDTKAEDMLRVYSEALVQKNDDDEWTILSIVAAAANKTVTVSAEDVDDSKSDVANDVLYFYPAGTTRNSVKYELADNAEYYVNGVKVGTFDNAAYAKYIYNAAGATDADKEKTSVITLQKETESGKTTTGTGYNVIMIDSYTTAVVDQVVPKTEQIRINFKEYDQKIKSNMVIELDDDNYTYSFKLNGANIDPADLQEDDVLTIAYDETGAFDKSDFYTVQVSRDTAEGKYTGKNSAGTEYTVGGVKYKVAPGMSINPDVSTEYTLYLDVNGKIAALDEISDSKNIGILKRVYGKSNGDVVAEIITKNGTVQEYDVDGSYNQATGAYTGDAADYVKLTTNVTSGAAVLTDYPNQVVEYKVSSSNKLTIKNDGKVLDAASVSATDNNAVVGAEFKASSNKIGSIKVSSATTILDISNADTKKDDISVLSIDNLKDGADYTAYGYDKSKSDSSCRFVIITDGDQGINSTSQLAVFIESGTDTNDEGDEVDTMTFVVNDEKTTYFVDDDANIDVTKFAEGDLAVFSTNSAGDIDEIEAVFNAVGKLNNSSYTAFFNDATAGKSPIATTDWKTLLSDGDQDNVEIKFGAVVARSGDTYTLATIAANGHVDLDAKNQDITISGDTKIYTYNFAGRQKDAGRITWGDGMQVTPDVTSAHANNDKSEADYNLKAADLDGDVIFAVVRTFDKDEAQEVYLIVND